MYNLLTTDESKPFLIDAQTKRKNDYIINKVRLWQSFQYVRPLLCRRCNIKLVPKVHRKSGKVCLRCSRCNFLQWSIPTVVLQSRLVIYEHAKAVKKKLKVNKKKKKKNENR